MAVIDLTAPVITLVFDKGVTIDATFWYLNPDFTAIDLTGFQAEGWVRHEPDVEPSIWTLSTVTGNLKFVAATVLNPYVFTDQNGIVHTLTDAQGVQFDIPAALTEAVTWDEAVFDIKLLAGSIVKPFIKGPIRPSVSGGC